MKKLLLLMLVLGVTNVCYCAEEKSQERSSKGASKDVFEKNAYIFLGYKYSRVNYRTFVDPTHGTLEYNTSIPKNFNSYFLHIGYEFHPHWAVEAFWSQSPTTQKTSYGDGLTVNYKVKAKNVGVQMLYGWNFWNYFNWHAIFGFVFRDGSGSFLTERSSETNEVLFSADVAYTSVNPVLGTGFRFLFDKHWALRIDGTYVPAINSVAARLSWNGIAGLEYHF